MWVRGELNLSKEQTGSSKEGGKSQGDREEGEKDRHERSESNRLRSCMIGLGVWVTILAGRSAHHAWIWRSEEPVFINAMRTCPLSAKVRRAREINPYAFIPYIFYIYIGTE